MAQSLYGVGKGLRVFSQDTLGDVLVELHSGTAVPDGTGDLALAPVGSIYLRSGTAGIFRKDLNNGDAGDWTEITTAQAVIGRWRGSLKVVTNDTITAGARNLSSSPFADDGSPALTAADFTVGDYAIGDADGTPALFQVSAVSSPNVTFAAASDPLVAEDTFTCVYYLPDPPTGENKALVNYNGSIIVKLSDIDWSIATGINLSGAYVAAVGNVLANDTVEDAIAKLDGVNDAQDTLLGTAQGATNLGSWTAPVDLLFSATSTVKALFQRIGDLLMQFRGVQVAGITASTVVDQVPVATVKAVKWFIEVFEVATPANRKAFEVLALNDGSTTVDKNSSGILKVGSNFNLTFDVVVATGNMQLKLASTTAGVTATVRRIEVVKSVL